MKTLIKPNWNNRTLTEVVEQDGKKFKLTCALRNGGGGNYISMLGNEGWARIFDAQELSKNVNTASYVSNVEERLEHANIQNAIFKKALKEMF